ncbi:hypothetical protein [Nocardioides yefusunii]|uniref:AtpZ/AtpI family protein n=1 Tax=Nocardioides yefusunii TaxID=2500546 RepID=A0ABW1QYQ5_9ACTN|nr:hypothetical protein [Nocardioides yefusunii]
MAAGSRDPKPLFPADPPGVTPAESTAGRMVVGFLVAGMFLVGLVVIVLIGVWADRQGIPMVYVTIALVAALFGVFTLLRRWADKKDAEEQAAAEAAPQD